MSRRIFKVVADPSVLDLPRAALGEVDATPSARLTRALDERERLSGVLLRECRMECAHVVCHLTLLLLVSADAKDSAVALGLPTFHHWSGNAGQFLVTKVIQGGPAALSGGVEVGDTIIKVRSSRILHLAVAVEAVRRLPARRAGGAALTASGGASRWTGTRSTGPGRTSGRSRATLWARPRAAASCSSARAAAARCTRCARAPWASSAAAGAAGCRSGLANRQSRRRQRPRGGPA